MAIKKYAPKYAIHPGKLLKRELEARSLTQKEFAARIGMTDKNLSDVLNAKARLQPSMAFAMEKAFGMPANVWLNLQQKYDLTAEENASIEQLNEDMGLIRSMDYSAISKRFSKLLPTSADIREKVVHMRRFLNISSLSFLFSDTKNAQVLAGAYRLSGLREKTVNKVNYLNLVTWMHAGMIIAEETEVTGFKKQALKRVLPDLVQASKNQDIDTACEELTRILQSVSIRTAFVPYLAKTYANGVTQWDKDGNPVITLSDFRGPYWDVLLFSWFHEIGHIYLHGMDYFSLSFSEKTLTFSQNSEKEEEADSFASDCLMPRSEYDRFVTQGDFSPSSIYEYSREIGVHPCILIGRLAKNGKLNWNSEIVSKRASIPANSSLFAS